MDRTQNEIGRSERKLRCFLITASANQKTSIEIHPLKLSISKNCNLMTQVNPIKTDPIILITLKYATDLRFFLTSYVRVKRNNVFVLELNIYINIGTVILLSTDIIRTLAEICLAGMRLFFFHLAVQS